MLNRSRCAWAHWFITVSARGTVGTPSTNGLGPRGALRRASAGVVGDQHVDVLIGHLAHAVGRGDVSVEPAEVGAEIEAGAAHLTVVSPTVMVSPSLTDMSRFG